MSHTVADRLGLLSGHLDHMEIAGRRPNTIKYRRQLLIALARFAGLDLADIGRNEIRAFLARDLKQNTRHVYLANIATFYAWCVDEELLQDNPTRRIPRPKASRGVPQPIDPADLTAAVNTARPRVRLWLMLGAYAGLRCMEIAALRGEDIDLGAFPRLVVQDGKGGRQRTVPLHPYLVRELAEWPREGWLFPSPLPRCAGRHVTASSVSAAINEHLHRLGIAHTAHKTRHLFGTSVHRAGRDAFLTADLMGHASMATTRGYVQSDDERAAAVVSTLRFGRASEAPRAA